MHQEMHLVKAPPRGGFWQEVEEAAGQAVWGEAASGTLWAAQRCGPAAAAPAEVWRALGALGARAPRAVHVGRLLLVRAVGRRPPAPPPPPRRPCGGRPAMASAHAAALYE